MTISRRFVLCLAAGLFVMGSARADARATPEEAKAMLAKAVAYLKANGKDKASAQFMDKQGGFIDRDLYVTVYDMTGKTLVHGANPRLVGKDNSLLQDADGRYIIKERLEVVQSKGKGMQEYKYLNPTNKEIETKLMYFEKVGDLVVACGAYKP
jgi:signal transduction histidine kinase